MSPDNWLETSLAQISRANVAVFGDLCLDAYWTIATTDPELSLETGLPVHRVQAQRYAPGGAGNVAANLAALGVARVRVIGLVGADLFGGELLRQFAARSIDTRAIARPAGWQTLVYAKPCAGPEELNRLDFGAFNQIPSDVLGGLLLQFDAAASECDAVVINQQIPSGLARAPETIAELNRIIARHPRTRFIVDSRHHAELFENAILKLNAHEAARIAGRARPRTEPVSAAEARQFAATLADRTGRPVFLTRGEHGLIVADGGRLHEIPGIPFAGPTDPVGAGDTVVATVAGVLAGGGDPLSAALLANLAASVTARKLQTAGAATPDEIRAAGASADCVWLPELAADPALARHLPNSRIELIREHPPARITHAVFDHDGTLSTLRQGWEKIMEPMMVRAILGPRPADAPAALLSRATAAVRAFIDRTTGVQTLTQMQGLAELVREFGRVPVAEILDARGYKALYLRELNERVRARLRRLERGERAPNDFIIPHARALLERLRAAGVRLYLASGTDAADVIAEARALGYAELFDGGIHGAADDPALDPKHAVLDRLLREPGLAPGAFAVFGDGPVEMREAGRRGGFRIGVASDEINRGNLNPAKRARLIRAGADVIIPDYAELPRLLALLDLAE